MNPPLMTPPSLNPSDRQWAVAIHLSGLLGLVTGYLSWLAPLIIWLIKKPESAYLDAVGKRVLNFQISCTLYFFILSVVIGLTAWFLVGFLFVPVLIIVGIAWLILTIMGGVKESNGQTFEYPLVIKFFV